MFDYMTMEEIDIFHRERISPLLNEIDKHCKAAGRYRVSEAELNDVNKFIQACVNLYTRVAKNQLILKQSQMTNLHIYARRSVKIRRNPKLSFPSDSEVFKTLDYWDKFFYSMNDSLSSVCERALNGNSATTSNAANLVPIPNPPPAAPQPPAVIQQVIQPVQNSLLLPAKNYLAPNIAEQEKKGIWVDLKRLIKAQISIKEFVIKHPIFTGAIGIAAAVGVTIFVAGCIYLFWPAAPVAALAAKTLLPAGAAAASAASPTITGVLVGLSSMFVGVAAVTPLLGLVAANLLLPLLKQQLSHSIRNQRDCEQGMSDNLSSASNTEIQGFDAGLISHLENSLNELNSLSKIDELDFQIQLLKNLSDNEKNMTEEEKESINLIMKDFIEEKEMLSKFDDLCSIDILDELAIKASDDELDGSSEQNAVLENAGAKIQLVIKQTLFGAPCVSEIASVVTSTERVGCAPR